MATAITLPNKQALIAGLQQQAQTSSGISGDFSFMKFTKQGEWCFGQDEIVPEEDSKWMVNPTIYSGFISWDEATGKPNGEHMASSVQPPIIEADLPEGNWQPQSAIQMVCTSGADDGTKVLFKTSSKGGIEAISNLAKTILMRLRDDPAEECFIPVVELDNTFYKHAKYGKIFKPVLDIVEWSDGARLGDEDEPVAAQEKAPEPEPEEAPKKTRSRSRG